MEKALKSVREAHQAELDNERYYQHQNYLAMQEQIKSLEEKNKQLTREKASISDETQRKLNLANTMVNDYRKLNQMILVDKYRQERSKKQLDDIQKESNIRLGTLQEQIKSLEEKNKRLSIGWAAEHKGLALASN